VMGGGVRGRERSGAERSEVVLYELWSSGDRIVSFSRWGGEFVRSVLGVDGK